MKLRLYFILIVLLVPILGFSFAQASTIEVKGINGIALSFEQNGITHNSTPGEFILTSDILAEPFGYCVEQGTEIWGGTFSVLSLNDLAGNYVNAAWLVDTYYYNASFSQNYQRAALQLAIWDVLGDGSIDDICNITNADTQSYFTTIQTLYGNSYNPSTIAGKGYKRAELQWDELPYYNVQDIIVRTVPEPASLLLFGFGLLGLGAMGRKKE